MNIIDFIPFGKDNAISRRALCAVTGLPDRMMRKEIERARRECAILNAQDGSGYFRPAEGEAYLTERWLKQERSREKSVREATRGAEKALLGSTRETYLCTRSFTQEAPRRGREAASIRINEACK